MIYKFGEFTLRPAHWYDLPLATTWTAYDLDHCRTTPPAFWIHQSKETNSFLLRTRHDPVFFFRIDERRERKVEVHIQFSRPDALRQGSTRRGLLEGFAWLEKMLSECGFEGYYFHSRNSQLIFFCQKRLGFEWDGTKLFRDLRRTVRDGQAEREDAQCAAQG